MAARKPMQVAQDYSKILLLLSEGYKSDRVITEKINEAYALNFGEEAPTVTEAEIKRDRLRIEKLSIDSLDFEEFSRQFLLQSFFELEQVKEQCVVDGVEATKKRMERASKTKKVFLTKAMLEKLPEDLVQTYKEAEARGATITEETFSQKEILGQPDHAAKSLYMRAIEMQMKLMGGSAKVNIQVVNNTQINNNPSRENFIEGLPQKEADDFVRGLKAEDFIAVVKHNMGSPEDFLKLAQKK